MEMTNLIMYGVGVISAICAIVIFAILCGIKNIDADN